MQIFRKEEAKAQDKMDWFLLEATRFGTASTGHGHEGFTRMNERALSCRRSGVLRCCRVTSPQRSGRDELQMLYGRMTVNCIWYSDNSSATPPCQTQLSQETARQYTVRERQ